jgi:hypothetical protein
MQTIKRVFFEAAYDDMAYIREILPGLQIKLTLLFVSYLYPQLRL